jgi:predicted PurR-regulated permease PerM
MPGPAPDGLPAGPPSYERPLTWALWAALGVGIAVILHAVRGALLPFLIAFVIAYVFAPWVDGLERRLRLPRPLGTAGVFVAITLLLALLILGLVPVVERQVMNVGNWLPGALDRLREVGIPFLSEYLGRAELPTTAGAWIDTLRESATSWGPAALKSGREALLLAATGTLGAVVWLLSAAIVPVLVFYLMMDFHTVGAWLLARVPAARRGDVLPRLQRIDTMLGQFLRGQLTVAVILAGLYAVGLTLAGVEAGVTIGVIAGLGNMVPYLGFVVGITLSLLVTFLTHFDVLHLLYVVAVFVVVQALEGTVISPRVVGERVGLHPIAVIFALFVGGEAFGFLGVLLGVPAAIAVKVALEPPETARAAPADPAGGPGAGAP